MGLKGSSGKILRLDEIEGGFEDEKIPIFQDFNSAQPLLHLHHGLGRKWIGSKKAANR